MKLYLCLISALVLFVACKDNSTSVTTETLGAPTNVTVSVIDSATLFVRWTRASNDKLADTVTFKEQGPPGTLTETRVVSTTDTSTYMRELHPGIQYSIVAKSRDNAAPMILVSMPLPAYPASNLQANSLSATSIGIRWTRGSNDYGNDTVFVANGANVVQRIIVAYGGSSAIVTGLTSGAIYSFSIRATGNVSPSLNWMTATRTEYIELFELGAPSYLGYSGLKLNGSGGQAQAISFTGSNARNADFVFEEYQGTLYFESTDVYDATYRAAWMSDTAIYAYGGLDMNYCGHDLSTLSYTKSGATSAIPENAPYSGSKIKLVRTADGNFARIEIDTDPVTGKLYGTRGGYRYITVNVSYQPVANQPYAARPQPHVPEVGYGTPRHVTQ